MKRRGSEGFILLAVLGVMVLLAGLTGAIALVVRSNIETARIELNGLSSDGLIQAGLEIAAYQLLVLNHPPKEVNKQQVRLNGGTVTIFVRSDSGKVDLNGSDPELLEAIYKASKLKTMTPRAFAARVVDWRDPDEEKTEDGAEGGEYASAGLPYRPANGSFRTVADLRYILGMRPNDVKRLESYFTVYNPGGMINLFDAPRDVLSALPGMRSSTVSAIIKAQRTRDERTAAQLLTLADAVSDFVTADVEVEPLFVLRIEVKPTNQVARTVEAVILPNPLSVGGTYRVVDWRE